VFADLEERGRERLADVPADRRRLERALDMRYRGQTYDLTVEAPDDLDPGALEAVAERFHEAHRERYGHASPDEPLELVTVRLRARGVVDPPDPKPPHRDGTVASAVSEERPVTFDGRTRDVRVYDRSRLPTGERFAGPAIVAGSESTLVVRPPDRVRVADDGSLVVEVDADV
jgi:N-methylhydantoinase A